MKKEKPSTDILFAGFGGQGIMFMGKLIAQAGMDAGKHVTWMPSYGAEVRGGTAYSMSKVSDAEVASPIVTDPDILVVMNKPSLLKYQSKLKDNGILIMNKSLIDERPARKGIKVFSIPMTEIAARIGDTRCANMVAVGALVKSSKLFSLRTVSAALKEMLSGKEDLFAVNKSALEKGYATAR
jgi:2-oxoglutarate ferredoxin oxidoreductase subunit gamma